MKLSNWKWKLLSGMLCFCLIFQSLTISAFAEEGAVETQITEIQEVAEEEIAEPSATEAPEAIEEPVATEEPVEYEKYEEVLPAEETTYGTFSNLTMVNKGFGVQITGGTYAYDLTGQTSSHYLYLACYDANDNRQSLQYVRNISGGSISSVSLYSQSYAVHEDTAYVRFELGTSKDNIIESYESFEVDGHPEITMSVSEVAPESGSVAITVAYTGDMENVIGTTSYGESITVELNYGTSEEEGTWSKMTSNVSFNQNNGNEQTAVFSGLESNTTYYGKVRFMVTLYDYTTYTNSAVWEQTVDIEAFTTKKSETYNLKETFPDSTFRVVVLDQLDNYDNTLTEDSDVTSEQLEKVTSLYLNRSSASAAAIKDITGVELLTGLTSLNLNYHEISSVDQIDWSKLSRLKSLYLEGNDITKLPDLSEHPSLSYLAFDYNLLSQEELDKAREVIPEQITLYSSLFVTQRTNGLELLYDEDNYIYGTAVPLTVYIKGYKKGLDYSIKTYIDGVEASMTLEKNYTPMRLSMADTKLAEGEHTIKVQLYSGETLIDETDEYTFNIVDEPIFVLKTPIYVADGKDVSSVYVDVYYSYSPSVSKMSIIDDAGKVYAESSYVTSNFSNSDSRYKVVTSASYRTLYRVYANMNTRYNAIPAGRYDLLITNTDGTETCLEDIVQVLDGSNAVITTGNAEYNYDSTGDYFYLNLTGDNIEPSKLDYSVVQFGKTYPVRYVTYKEMYNGVIVKLKKEGWTKLAANHSAQVTIAPKSGYEIIDGAMTFDIYINTNVFYCDYNPVTNMLEAAFTNAPEVNNTIVTVNIREGSNQNTYPVIASGSAVVSNGVAYFELKNADGTAFAPSTKSYYMFFEVNGTVYQASDYINVNNGSASNSYNYWGVSPALQGIDRAYAYYYTDIPYDANMDLSQFSLSITGENLSVDNIDEYTGIFQRNGCVAITVGFAASSLETGSYQLDLYRGGKLFSQTPGTLTILDTDQFIMNSAYLSWENTSEMSLYVNTPFVRENDEYEVILTDYSGNMVEGLSTAVTERYSDSVQISVRGLDYADAQRYYYVKVLHKTLGEPVTLSGNAFYSDARGTYSQIYYSQSASHYTENNRVVGIYANSAKLPITVKVYKPYDADIVNEIIIESNDLQDGVYHFTKTFFESLPDADSLYDLITIDDEGRCSVYEGAVLGYFGMYGAIMNWTYTVDKTLLYVNKEDENTATIKVADNTEAPAYNSSNTNVVTVTPSKDDSSMAILKAVGVGEAVITITVGDSNKTFTVTVESAVEKIELNEKYISLNAMDYVELQAAILPTAAQKEGQHITFTSSNESVVMIWEEYDNNMVLLRAMEPGTAIITAVLDGTELSASCEINVPWEYTLDVQPIGGSVALYINREDEKTANIQVIGSKTAKPVFKSSNTGVVTVAAVSGEPTKAVITATGIGEAQISITADGITKEFSVVVDRKLVVEELVLNRDNVSLTAGESQELTVSIVPAEIKSSDLAISVSSSNGDIVAADMTDNNNVIITAVSEEPTTEPVTITVSASVDGEIFADTCDVTVVGVFDEDTQNEKATAEKQYVLLNTFAKNTATLKDIPLSEGWTWVDDSVKLTADNNAPVQYYGAVYEETGYQPFTALIPVAVSKLTGIAIEGSKTLTSEKTDDYDITLKYTGYQPATDDAHDFDSHYSVAWTASGKTPFVTITESEETTAVQLTAVDVTANKSQTVKAVLTIDGDAKKTFSANLKLTVLAKPYVDKIEIMDISDASTIPYTCDVDKQTFNVNLEDIITEKVVAAVNGIYFQANASALEEASSVKLKWTSSDTSVAVVKAYDNGSSANVTVKKAGSTVIKVTAQDGGKFTEEFVVVVKDYKPIVETKSVAVNLYSTEGTSFVIREQNGNAIESVALMENDEVSSRLTIVKDGNSYTIKAAENSGITKKTTIKPQLWIVTEDGELHKEIISVAVNLTKPTASLSVKNKANLFYKNAEAVYKVNSTYEIDRIEEVESSSYCLNEYNAEEGTITFAEAEWSADIMAASAGSTTKANSKNVTLKVYFVGYTDEAAKTITVNVATTKIKPSLKLNDMVFAPGVTEGVTQVYDTKAKQIYTLSDAENISSITNNVTAQKVDGGIRVVYDGAKSVSYKANISCDEWNESLTLSGKITVVKKQNLVLDTTKVTLNTATCVQKNGTTAIGVSVKNHDAKVESITYTTDKSSVKLINSGYLYFDFDEDSQQILIGLNQGKQGSIKNGTYKLTIYGTVNVAGQSVELVKTTLSIVLTNKAPAVTLTAKGSIDLIQRDNTSILYTSKLTNITADVVDVRLSGSYAEYFESQMVDGKVQISAADSPMSTQINYPVEVILTLDNGIEVSKTVKIKPVNKTPKVTAELTKGTLYKAGANANTFGVKSSVAAAEIEKICQVEDKNSKYFNFNYDADTEKITISLSEEASKLKPGKYTVSYQVYFEGAAYNVKPVTVKFTATVK